jgi:putative glycosyl hydrolase-like family 15 (GHL15) protein
MRRALQSLSSVCAPIIALLLLASVARAITVSHVVGHVDVAISSDARINPRYTAGHEQVVILQAWETAEVRRLKRANPDVTVLMYQNAASVSTSAAADGLYPTGVSYPEAAAHHWLLDDTSGQPFTFEGENWLYAADIGARGYERAWAHNVLRSLSRAPWDGVFIDDLNPTIRYHDCVSCVAKYPSDRRYGAAMGRFARLVGRHIRASGKLAVANIGSWAGYQRVVDPWLHSLSGAMDEEFVKVGDAAGAGYMNESTWREQLHEVRLTQTEHKIFIGITHSSARDRRAALYGFATELLAGAGEANFAMNANYSTTTWFRPYGYRLGAPLARYRIAPGGVYERSFADGQVLVNPTTHPSSVLLGGSYSGCGLHRVSQVTIGAQSALVLTRSGSLAQSRRAASTRS